MNRIILYFFLFLSAFSAPFAQCSTSPSQKNCTRIFRNISSEGPVGPFKRIRRIKTSSAQYGTLVSDTGGRLWYLKEDSEHSELQTGAEITASRIYTALGFDVPGIFHVDFNGRRCAAVEWNEEAEFDRFLNDNQSSELGQLRIFSAYLKDWDRLRSSHNVKGEGDHFGMTDFGGTLGSRAEGGHKEDGSTISEAIGSYSATETGLEIIQRFSVNWIHSSHGWRNLRPEDIRQAFHKLRNLTDDDIDESVNAARYSKASDSTYLKHALKSRRDALLKDEVGVRKYLLGYSKKLGFDDRNGPPPPEVVSSKILEKAIDNQILVPEEFNLITQMAQKRGLRVFLWGGTATTFALHTKRDVLQREGSLPNADKNYSDYSLPNIYLGNQDYDLMVMGVGGRRETQEELLEFQAAIDKRFPSPTRQKSPWEVAGLHTQKSSNQTVPTSFDYQNTHKDSHSSGLIELTKPADRESRISDVKDPQSPIPRFLSDVAQGKVHFYYEPRFYETGKAKRGSVAEIEYVIRYLTKVFRANSEIEPESVATLKKIISEFNPSRLTGYPERSIRKNTGPKLIELVSRLPYAARTLEELGLSEKLASLFPGYEVLSSTAPSIKKRNSAVLTWPLLMPFGRNYDPTIHKPNPSELAQHFDRNKPPWEKREFEGYSNHDLGQNSFEELRTQFVSHPDQKFIWIVDSAGRFLLAPVYVDKTGSTFPKHIHLAKGQGVLGAGKAWFEKGKLVLDLSSLSYMKEVPRSEQETMMDHLTDYIQAKIGSPVQFGRGKKVNLAPPKGKRKPIELSGQANLGTDSTLEANRLLSLVAEATAKSDRVFGHTKSPVRQLSSEMDRRNRSLIQWYADHRVYEAIGRELCASVGNFAESDNLWKDMSWLAGQKDGAYSPSLRDGTGASLVQDPEWQRRTEEREQKRIDDINEVQENVEEAIYRAPRIKGPVTLYRGEVRKNRKDIKKEGEILKRSSPYSASLDPEMATHFSTVKNDHRAYSASVVRVKQEIRIPAGETLEALYIPGALSKYQEELGNSGLALHLSIMNELELLIQSNVQFKVLNLREGRDSLGPYLEQVVELVPPSDRKKAPMVRVAEIPPGGPGRIHPFLDRTRYVSHSQFVHASKLLGKNEFSSSHDPKFIQWVRSPEAKAHRQSLEAIAWSHDPRNLPIVDSSLITERESVVRTHGKNHDGLIFGKMGAIPIVVKYDRISAAQAAAPHSIDYGPIIYESAMAIWANKLGSGPRYLGIFQEGNKIGLVAERAPGINSNYYPIGKITAEQEEQIRDTARRMSAGGIYYGGRSSEFQFLMSEGRRAVLIDFGGYFFRTPEDVSGKSTNEFGAEYLIRTLGGRANAAILNPAK